MRHRGVFSQDRRTWLLQLVAAGALGFPGLRQVLAMSGKPKEGIYRLRGEIRINGVPAQEGSPVKAGDTVTAGSNSHAVFVLGRDAFLIRENSRVRISGNGSLVESLRIITGRVLSVFGKGQRHVETVIATIGLRGTACYVEADENLTYVCVCYGDADLSDASTGQLLERVSTTHHESPRFIYPGSKGPIIERAGVINHTDEELILLESTVGRQPPFVDLQSDYDYY